MSEENKAKYRRFMEEVVTNGNFAVVDELVSPDFVYHTPGSQDLKGPDGIKQMIGMYRTAFPDLHMHVEEQIAEGDTVVTRWTAHGTHNGELQGIPASGNEVTITGVAIGRFAAGLMVEETEIFDSLGMMQQIGAIPSQ